MNTVKVKKPELLEILRTNRAEHKKIFEEAVEGYRQTLLSLLEARVSELKDGKQVRHYIDMDEPMCQIVEYDTAIKMVEMSVDEELELTEKQFRELVMDQWSWTGLTMASNVKYSSSARSKLKSLGS